VSKKRRDVTVSEKQMGAGEERGEARTGHAMEMSRARCPSGRIITYLFLRISYEQNFERS
jgi:hypothetical protein